MLMYYSRFELYSLQNCDGSNEKFYDGVYVSKGTGGFADVLACVYEGATCKQTRKRVQKKAQTV